MITEKRISEKLRSLGVPANLKGFFYLKTALIFMDRNPNYIHYMTKGLYPDIAKEHGTTASRVERSIRHAIEKVYLVGNLKEIQSLGTYSCNKGKMTNSEFIASLYEKMKFEEEDDK